MKSNISPLSSQIFGYILPWVTLAVLLLFTYALHFKTPYEGFHWDSQGIVQKIYSEDQLEPTLQVGDQLVKIGSVLWENFKADLQQQIFVGVQPGDVVPLQVERNGQPIDILWEYPGPTSGEVKDQLTSQGWLSYAFWAAGTIALLSLRPKDERQKLLVAFNYLIAIWLVIGSGVSRYHIWHSAQILHLATWLLIPVSLHLHWYYPRPLGRLPRVLVFVIYTGAFLVGLLDWFQIIPANIYMVGFLLAVMGSFLLLVFRFFLRPHERPDLRLLFALGFLALVPSIVIGVLSSITILPVRVTPLALVSLPLLPVAYLYTAFRQRLGGSEIRVNRLLTIYLFAVLLGVLVISIVMLVPLQIESTGTTFLVETFLSFLMGTLGIIGFPYFQKFVERRWFGIRLPPKDLLKTYSSHITASASLEKLLDVLENQVMASLLVREFVFLQSTNGTLKKLSSVGISIEPEDFDFDTLLDLDGTYRSPQILNPSQPYPWVRLVLYLKIERNVIGFWLFGRRDPDDYYSQVDINTLQSLANQTAIALSNILQTERLRTMYQANVNRFEDERLYLALELHDSILNQLAVLQMNLETPSEKFQDAYDALAKRLREIVSDLRPPMLNYGLKPAIEGLADTLMERSKDTIQIEVDIRSDGCRYPEKTELHLFRIVQEACENALRHAQAMNIAISGILSSDEIDLSLKDDGVGFNIGKNLQLDTLIANKHFGLAGMIERAAIIGADVRIESQPEAGTSIQIVWKSGRE